MQVPATADMYISLVGNQYIYFLKIFRILDLTWTPNIIYIYIYICMNRCIVAGVEMLVYLMIEEKHNLDSNFQGKDAIL